MSKHIRSINSKVRNFKKFCYEQLWVLALFAPLIVVAMLVVQNYQPSSKQATKATKSRSIAAVAIEITSVELALIIAKPLSELLLIEVYFDGKHKVRNRAALETGAEVVFSKWENRELMIDQTGHNGEAEIVFSLLPRSLNYKKIGENS